MKLSKGNIELMRESFQAIQFACNYIFWSFKECNSLYITVLSDVFIVANVVVLSAP